MCKKNIFQFSSQKYTNQMCKTFVHYYMILCKERPLQFYYYPFVYIVYGVINITSKLSRRVLLDSL